MMMIFFSRHKEYLLRGCLKSLHGFLQRYPHAMVIVDFRELRTIVTSSEAALHQLKTLMSGLFKQPLRRACVKNSLIVSRPTPRLSPKVYSVATRRRISQRRPSSVSHNHDSGERSRRAMACLRRCTLLLDIPVSEASCRILWLAFSQRLLKIRTLLVQNPMSVGPLKDD